MRGDMSNPDAGPRSDSWAIEELFLSLSRGDLAGARSCFAPNARVWHSFDCIALTVDQACSGFSAFIAAFPERSFRDIQRAAIPGSFVQRHLTVALDAQGVYRAWPTCVFVTLQDHLIIRLDEYLDRAGGLRGNLVLTPGLA
jgi:uncharacterized protein